MRMRRGPCRGIVDGVINGDSVGWGRTVHGDSLCWISAGWPGWAPLMANTHAACGILRRAAVGSI